VTVAPLKRLKLLPLSWRNRSCSLGRDVLDQVLVECFLIGEGLRLADGAFGELDVATALGDDGAHEGGGVVLDLSISSRSSSIYFAER
jgi:hypothetical protein